MTTTIPPLPPRTIAAYRRLTKPLASLIKATRSKPVGPVGLATIASCNRVIVAANHVFSREGDIAKLPLLKTDAPLTPLDLTILVDELMVATRTFEERYHEVETPPQPTMP